MEYNKEEARKAIDIAERKVSNKDYVGAKRFVNKAQNLYPNLDGLNQVLMMIDVFISSASNVGGESDWYGILGVDPLADDETVKKQYRKLALLLHPDKNKFEGAEGAFKLVSEAWCLLSDKDKRIAFDQKRKSKGEADNGMMQKPPPKPRRKKPAPADSSKQRKGSDTFWTMCCRCNTQCEYLRDKYLNKALNCPNCRQTFIATDMYLQANVLKPSVKLSSSSTPRQQKQQSSSRNKNTNGASSSSWTSAATATQKTPQASAKSQETSQDTSGGTYSERTNPPPYVGFSYNFQWNFSMSAKTSSNGGKAANKAQDRVKSWFEEPQEKVAAAERMLKKARTDVR